MTDTLSLTAYNYPERRAAASDQDALLAAARTDPREFIALYDLHADAVYGYVRSRLDADEDAADLTQQVFLDALTGLQRFRGSGSTLRAWLFRIARNKVADFYRRRPRHSSLYPDAEPAVRLLEPGPEDVALRREEQETLRRLVASLDAEQRDLLALRFAADLTHAEIARVIGKREAAVRQRLSRLLKHLRKAYDHER